jgi:hypothetical protein
VPTAGEGNWLRQLKMANDTQCRILIKLHKYATSFTVPVIQGSYKTATTGYLSVRRTCLYHVRAFTFTKPDHTRTLFVKDSIGVDAVLRHAQDVVQQFTLLQAAKSHDTKGNFV